MSFYLSSATGDSSLIEPASFTEKIDVRVTTLDIFDQENNIKKCKLLKLEAEGSEPEILNGARNFYLNASMLQSMAVWKEALMVRLPFQKLIIS